MRVLVTGGSRGLGRAICEAYLARNDQVAFTSRKEASIDGALWIQGDVSDAKHAAAAVDAVVAKWGGIDVLVNNAGQMQVLPLALLEEADWDKAFATNVKGAFLFSRAALKHMLKAKKGHILNVGSFGADRVVEAPVHYAATKAALHGFSTALAKEVGRYGVAVNYIASGILQGGVAARQS